MTSRFSVTTEATYEEVAVIRKILPIAAAGLGFPHALILRLEICLTEALHNVVRHGYCGRSGTVEVTFTTSADQLEIELADHGTPMPEKAREGLRGGPAIPDRSATAVQDLPEGGLGIPILRTVLDDLEYRTGSGRNVLRMVKRAPARVEPARA